jgi:ATP-dependent DNA helicase PIF1
MIDGRFWDKLEEIARHVRGNNEPFGGIQVRVITLHRKITILIDVLSPAACSVRKSHHKPRLSRRCGLTRFLPYSYRCGDFFQLPPVPDRHDRTSVFAFQARTWSKCIKKIFTLTQVFRQKAGSKTITISTVLGGTGTYSSCLAFRFCSDVE